MNMIGIVSIPINLNIDPNLYSSDVFKTIFSTFLDI